MCVVTKLNFFEGQLSQSVHPDPFRNECLNMIEWLMVSMIPFLVIGFVSLVFLLRKVSATTSYGGHSTPGYELVRGKMIIWHNSFSCGHFWGLIRHLVVYFLLMTRLISIGKSTSGLTSGSKIFQSFGIQLAWTSSNTSWNQAPNYGHLVFCYWWTGRISKNWRSIYDCPQERGKMGLSWTRA